MTRYPAALLLAAALAPAAARAQSNATVPDPDPEVERKSFIVAPGFEVNLYAADPLLAKPIQMNFDPEGRLWVATSEVYPQIKPGQKANDKIIVLEDADGDGRAEKTTVFADGLLIPTGVAPGDGGAYVANSTELIHLSASQPGGKADRSRVVLSGFGTEDTHHIVHTFRWGPDGALYFNQSVYIHSHIETPHGVRRLNAGGIWRLRPDDTDLGVFVRGFWNPWGHQFDRWGQSLITDGANGEGPTHGVPGASYPAAAGATRILHGMNPGSPKHCGLEIVGGRHLPADWQGNVITNDFRGHRVCRFALRDSGSSYESRELPELIKTNHPAFRPVDVAIGPDGAIYIADWYNPIIQHGEVDFRDPRRDHTHGRIWRVTAKGRPLVPRPNLVGAALPDLLDRLKDPEDWTRAMAKRVLKERAAGAARADVLATVGEWVKRIDPADPQAEHHLLEALWVTQSLGAVDPGLLARLLGATNPNARAAAVRVASYVPGVLPDTAARLAHAATDDAPRVRLEAVRALAGLRTPDAAAAALRALDKPTDAVLDYALWLTVRELEPYWLPAFRAGTIDFGGNVRHLEFALRATESGAAVRPLLALLQSGKIDRERVPAVWTLVAKTGGPAELQTVFEHILKSDTPPAELAALLAALDESARQRNVRPAGDLSGMTGLMMRPEEAVASAAVRLGGRWKLPLVEPTMVAVAEAADGKPAVRLAAIEALGLHGGQRARQTLGRLATAGDPPAARAAAVAALTGVDLPAAAAAAVSLAGTAPTPADLQSVYAAFLARRGGAAALTAALAGKALPPDAAKVGLRAIRSSTQTVPALVDALTKAGNLSAAKADATPADVRAYVVEVSKAGDPARGEAVFRRKELQCIACHGVGGAGGQVGPDLTSIGASAPIDYLVESILLPNKAVKEGYHAVTVNTADGTQVAGIKVRETDKELVLRTSEDKEVTVPKADLDGAPKPTRSLMPDGLADPLTRQEFVDLVRFLSELGKVGPYAPSKARVVRRWQVIEPTPENLNLFRRARVSAAAENPAAFAWSPAYARVSGELPLGELPKFVVWSGSEPQSVVRCQLDVSAGGPVTVKLNSPAGVALYVGPAPVEPKAEMTLTLTPGLQILTFVIDRAKRADDLRLELEDVPGSPARVGIVGGK